MKIPRNSPPKPCSAPALFRALRRQCICSNVFFSHFCIERGLNEVQLPDQNMGVILYNGQMTGLDNLSRSGDALLEAATDHFLLSFSIEANDVKAKYWWKKQRLK